MIAMTLAEVAEVVGGEVHGDAAVRVTGPAFVDSRTPEEGGLFLAFVGRPLVIATFRLGRRSIRAARSAAAPLPPEDPGPGALAPDTTPRPATTAGGPPMKGTSP